GSTITLLDIEFEDELTVTLVGAFESDPAAGAVSISSPMGTALVDQIVGAMISVQTPGGVAEYKILKIE
ncbi:MAG TPA: GreA/GreB family elongation factor, partial [Fimbriimonas sp.]|nr:GreA/GreB family elongation factor [Fimbriimonas sp.]